MTIKIGLFGFGRTGRVVAQEIIAHRQCELAWVMRKTDRNVGEHASDFFGLKPSQGRIFCSSKVDFRTFYDDHPVDMIIDFSARAALRNYNHAARRGIRIVSAISKYTSDDIAQLQKMSQRTAILYSPNITLGINFLIVASRVLKQIAPGVDIEVVEEHFRGKKEVSGTAIRIADVLGLCKNRHVNSIRAGGIIGKHEVIFGFPNQTIRIVHESINRSAFAKGAIYAAKWLVKKKRGMFTMERIISADFARHSSNLNREL